MKSSGFALKSGQDYLRYVYTMFQIKKNLKYGPLVTNGNTTRTTRKMNEWAFGWIIMVRTMKTPTSFHVTNEIISLFERVLLLLLFLLPLLLLLVGQNTLKIIIVNVPVVMDII